MKYYFRLTILVGSLVLGATSLPVWGDETYFGKLYGSEYRDVTDEMSESFNSQYGKPWDETTFQERQKFLLKWHKTHIQTLHAKQKIQQFKTQKVVVGDESLNKTLKEEQKKLLAIKKEKAHRWELKKKKEQARKEARLKEEERIKQLKDKEKAAREKRFREYIARHERNVEALKRKQENRNRQK